MEYLRVDTSIFHSPEYIGATPIQRSTWFSLIGYCAIQENGGLIEMCSEWGNRRWMQTCGVTNEEIADLCDLWRWEDAGQSILVAFYPIQDEDKCKRLRKRAKVAGAASAKARREKKLNHMVEQSGSTEDRIGEDRRGEEQQVEASQSLDIDDIRIKCYVGPGEEGAFLKIFKQFTRKQGLKLINKLSAQRIQNGDAHERPPLSMISTYVQKHFNQIKEWV